MVLTPPSAHTTLGVVLFRTKLVFTTSTPLLPLLLTTNMTSFTLTNEQFQALLAGVVPRNLTTERVITWTDLPALDTTKMAEVDGWFQAFEVKMRAMKIAEEHWAERLEECPKVPQELKRQMASEDVGTYDQMRRHVLEQYGPVDPVGYFRAQLYNVRGANREEIVRPRVEPLDRCMYI